MRGGCVCGCLYLLLCLVILSHAQSGPLAPPGSDYSWASEAAVEKWHDMKFGLRIHWGSYAIHGIGPESWPLNQHRTNASFLRWYWEQPSNWNPTGFDADGWIALMRRAGIKFFDFTTKHHEGFSMFHTNARVHDCWGWGDDGHGGTAFLGIVPCNKTSPAAGIAFSSTSVFNRDITGELVAAARRGGIAPGLYFSHIDWFDADMRIDQWNPLGTGGLCKNQPCDPQRYTNTSHPLEWSRFVLRHRAQIAEILTKYGEIFELSFDMNFPPQFDQDMSDTVMLARTLAPNTLFRGRGMGGYKGDCDARTAACGMGDYETPEESFPDKPVPGNWQVIYHGSNFMSYDPDPAHYVNGSFILWHLVDIVSKGGLMQIGYGPDANGHFHPKAVEALEYAGRWLATNGEGIYNTRAMPAHWNDTASSMVRYTQTKDTKIVYAHVLSGFGSAPIPSDHSLPLACVKLPSSSSVTLLGYVDEGTRRPIPIKWDRQGSMTVINIPDDLDRHPAVMQPALVFRLVEARPQNC